MTVFEYSFTQSYWCVCGNQLEIVESKSDGKETKTILKPCSKCVDKETNKITGWKFVKND